jgi:hypothetical protein
MKMWCTKYRFITLVALLWLAGSATAQLYHPGERLYYRVAYRAKMIPNTEMAEVTIETEHDELNGRPTYRVRGNGRTLSIFKWFFNLNDTYRIWVDTLTLRTLRFESDIYEGGYTFRSNYHYDWDNYRVYTWSQSRNRPPRTKSMPLTDQSKDAVSLYFGLRSVPLDTFNDQRPRELEMVLDDTIRTLKYRFIGREECRVPRRGLYRTLKFACTLGSSEEFSFTNGSEFFIWISDDENKVPIMLSSPIRVGSIRAYLRDYEGLKYPMSSKMER